MIHIEKGESLINAAAQSLQSQLPFVVTFVFVLEKKTL